MKEVMRILLVEDERRMAGFIERGLKEESYAIDMANDGEAALYLAGLNPYDLIILDIMLPKKDGVAVCREIRNQKMDTPILLLTAKSSVKDKVLGFNSGADDYLSKPFEFEELLARVQALLRRRSFDKSSVLKVADLELNQLNHQATRAGKEISLTSKEFALLRYLMLHENQIVTRTMISEHVWNEDFDTFTNVIDVYINYLRNKIDKGFGKPLIHTVRATGYLLKDDLNP